MSLYFINFQFKTDEEGKPLRGEDGTAIPANRRTDWGQLDGVSELTTENVDDLGPDDIVFIHATDMESGCNWEWLSCVDPAQTYWMKKFGDKIRASQCGELVFFTGGGWGQFVGSKNILDRYSNIFGRADKLVFGPDDVPSGLGAVSAFGDFVTEYQKSSGKLHAHDFFSVQRRELKSSFRLLVQTWLVAKGKKELFSVTAEIAKDIVADPKFWAPVEVDNDLHQKLKEALGREELLKGWTPRKPQDEDAKRLIKWAFPANL